MINIQKNNFINKINENNYINDNKAKPGNLL